MSGPNIEQDLEVAAVAGLVADQVEGQRQAVEIELRVNFAGKPAVRSARELALPEGAVHDRLQRERDRPRRATRYEIRCCPNRS